MCKAPKPPKQKEPDKPEFLRNRYLDAALGGSASINQIRRGRSDLRIRPDVDGAPQPSGLSDLTDGNLQGFIPSIRARGARTSPTPSIGPRPISGRRLRAERP